MSYTKAELKFRQSLSVKVELQLLQKSCLSILHKTSKNIWTFALFLMRWTFYRCLNGYLCLAI